MFGVSLYRNVGRKSTANSGIFFRREARGAIKPAETGGGPCARAGFKGRNALFGLSRKNFKNPVDFRGAGLLKFTAHSGRPGRTSRTGLGRAAGKKIRKYFRTGVDRAAASLLKSQPAPRTGKTRGTARKTCSLTSEAQARNRRIPIRRGCGKTETCASNLNRTRHVSGLRPQDRV